MPLPLAERVLKGQPSDMLSSFAATLRSYIQAVPSLTALSRSRLMSVLVLCSIRGTSRSILPTFPRDPENRSFADRLPFVFRRALSNQAVTVNGLSGHLPYRHVLRLLPVDISPAS